MTQEEKARAYDKAIEKIKYVMEHGVSPVLNKEDLQDLFPELQESEDERIIKAQLDYWRSVGGKEWHGVPVQETIAWLEKQGKKPQVDGFDSELNALLKKYEHLSKKELREPLEFYLDVVRENPNHHEGWINIYKNSSIDIYETDGLVYESEEMALEARHDYDIATIKIEWEEQQ